MTPIATVGFSLLGAFVSVLLLALRRLHRQAESERAEELLRDAISEIDEAFDGETELQPSHACERKEAAGTSKAKPSG